MEPSRWQTLLVFVGLLGGCTSILGIDELSVGPPDAGPMPDAAPDAMAVPDAQSSFVVRGVAYGLLAPVSLELRYGDSEELLSIVADGPFAFLGELRPGASYAVVFVGEPPCVLGDAVGVITNADPEVTLACESVFLSELTLSGPTAPALSIDPARAAYQAEVSLLQSYTTVTAVPAHAEASITIDGSPVANGTASAPIALNLDENAIEVTVTGPGGGTRTYTVTVRRAAQIAQAAYGKASNTDSLDYFGFKVALSGDTLAVSAHREDSAATGFDGDPTDDSAEDSGAVYVFRRNGTSWAQEAYLKASNTDADDRFGYSVALFGDTLAVGAYHEDSAATGINEEQDDNTATDSGAVYVFRHNGTNWVQEAYLKASNTDAGDNFGFSLALSGDTLAVGAYHEDSAATGINDDQADNAASDSGAVYVFQRSGTNWVQEAYLKPSNTDAGDSFGSRVALSGDSLAVSASSEDSSATGVDGNQDDNSASDSGAVYLFRRSGTSWAQEAYLKASNTDAEDYFGSHMFLSGDSLAVSAGGEDSAATGVDGDQNDNSASDSGAVYVFRRSDTSWAQMAYLKASNTDAYDTFGSSVALAGDSLAVGAFFEDSTATGTDGDQSDDSAKDSGAVYVFQHNGTSWAQVAYLKASNTDGNDLFGASVALSDDALAVSALFEGSAATGFDGNQDDNSLPLSGAVYIFH